MRPLDRGSPTPGDRVGPTWLFTALRPKRTVLYRRCHLVRSHGVLGCGGAIGLRLGRAPVALAEAVTWCQAVCRTASLRQ